jgi:hypothetical protein
MSHLAEESSVPYSHPHPSRLLFPEVLRANGNRAAALPFFMALMATAASANASVTVPAVPSNVNCQFSATAGTVCGLYHDVSGSASASFSTGQSFSYQPAWEYTSSRLVDDGAADGAGGSSASAHATDFVTFGALKSQLNSASATSGGQTKAANAGSSTSSTIGFQDRLTFTKAGVPAGTLGTMTGRIYVSGTVDASAASYPYTTSQASAAVSVSSSNGLVTRNVAAYGDRASTGGIPSVITFTVPVKFNEPNFTLLFVQLQTSASSGALWGYQQSFSASANANFFSSADWGGIDSVVDDKGNAVSGWGVSSASGFDYTRSWAAQVVPEPAGWMLMVLGLGLLGGLRKRAMLRAA